VTRLEALAHGLPRPVTVIEDARRGEVYVQDFLPQSPEGARLSGIADLHLLYGPGDALVGSAAAEVARQWDGAAVEPRFPLAEAIARIGAERAAAPRPRPAPFYLRGADAAPPADLPPVILP
jgi:tRNA A37 threonylcarbamoyladenosine modification protein TsaB